MKASTDLAKKLYKSIVSENDQSSDSDAKSVDEE